MGAARRLSSDPTVLATPLYFATMLAESRWLRRRRPQRGPSAGDYERRDTVASLAMGQASLLIPLVAPKVLRALSPSRGRIGRALLGGAAGLAVATTVLDRRARWARGEGQAGGSAARAASVTGVGALALGGLALTSWWNTALTPAALHRRSPRADIANPRVALAMAVLGWDFIYYWNHRFMHTRRYMWAMHVVHHSSEHYNLSTALRQPVAEALTTPVPYGLLCLVGITPETLNTARGINLLWQYWIHTDTIGRLGSAEGVLNTPSAHRVHHGSNRQYLDRNHGSIFIIWDRLFGTFEPEDEPVVYGLTKNIGTFNPLVIIGHEYAAMARDVAAATGWTERLGHVVRGPGWRPDKLELTTAQPRLAAEGT